MIISISTAVGMPASTPHTTPATTATASVLSLLPTTAPRPAISEDTQIQLVCAQYVYRATGLPALLGCQVVGLAVDGDFLAGLVWLYPLRLKTCVFSSSVRRRNISFYP